jgi:putative AlgH/UPF0301 family transcriptional regulator
MKAFVFHEVHTTMIVAYCDTEVCAPLGFHWRFSLAKDTLSSVTTAFQATRKSVKRSLGYTSWLDGQMNQHDVMTAYWYAKTRRVGILV